jgi:hypothetical protein
MIREDDFNNDSRWIIEKAEAEDGCDVSVGIPSPMRQHPWSICPSCKSRFVSERIQYSCSSMTCEDCGHQYTDWYGGER